ncbi:hypothetical protein [Streptomyces sp. NPDC055243]|uniref:hypothetical protein n=1 Tax=Streptomyces sp. NPDC055243 TaxID=3365720 RepID=UPI0037CEA3E5
MSTPTLRPAPTQPGLSVNDRIAHDLTMQVRAPQPASPVDRAVIRFEQCLARVERLSRVDVRDRTPVQVESLDEALSDLAALRALLAAAGALHRVELS